MEGARKLRRYDSRIEPRFFFIQVPHEDESIHDFIDHNLSKSLTGMFLWINILAANEKHGKLILKRLYPATNHAILLIN